MKARDIINPIETAFFRRKRREPPVFVIAAGVVFAAAAVALFTPSTRRSLRSLLQRTGGGIGKQLGKLIGEQAGAHPQQTAEFVHKARELVGSSEHATS
ncbi:MAG TPA: hypothetical protein VNN80_04880 [Polyangiaceae bacterium]|nr:hypothetical protein [Polyangiaceae bacterium]